LLLVNHFRRPRLSWGGDILDRAGPGRIEYRPRSGWLMRTTRAASEVLSFFAIAVRLLNVSHHCANWRSSLLEQDTSVGGSAPKTDTETAG
jgi:hypothetical protein